MSFSVLNSATSENIRANQLWKSAEEHWCFSWFLNQRWTAMVNVKSLKQRCSALNVSGISTWVTGLNPSLRPFFCYIDITAMRIIYFTRLEVLVFVDLFLSEKLFERKYAIQKCSFLPFPKIAHVQPWLVVAYLHTIYRQGHRGQVTHK